MLKAKCNRCQKNRWFARQRYYTLNKVPASANPVKSEGKLCGECYRRIKKLFIKVNNENK